MHLYTYLPSHLKQKIAPLRSDFYFLLFPYYQFLNLAGGL